MTTELYSEEDILKGCRQGRRHFQEILYRRHAKKMYGICMSYAGDRAFAQDMLQEAFVKVFKSLDDFKGKGSLEGWVRKIVIRTAIDLLRQRAGKENFFDDAAIDHLSDNQNIVYNNALPELGLKELMGFISRLPEGARLVFNLFAMEGYSHKEIARELNITEGTSKSQFNRARNILKSWLGEQYR